MRRGFNYSLKYKKCISSVSIPILSVCAKCCSFKEFQFCLLLSKLRIQKSSFKKMNLLKIIFLEAEKGCNFHIFFGSCFFFHLFLK